MTKRNWIFVISAALALTLAIGFIFFLVVKRGDTGRDSVLDSAAKSGIGSARAGCERSKQNSALIEKLSRGVLEALHDTDRRNTEPLSKNRISAESKIENSIDAVQIRANIDCKKAFPYLKVH